MTNVMISVPRHEVPRQARLRAAQSAPGGAQPQAAGASDIDTKLFDQKSWITSRFQAMMPARTKQGIL
jgi:hypothetical protein